MKKVKVLIGLPGSGKSTKTRQLVEALSEEYSSAVHSTDSYFIKDGEYRFDPKKLGYFHKLNLEAFKKSLDSNVNLIIVDNTNIKARDRRPYIDSAHSRGYDVECIVIGEFTEEFAKICAERNTHGVPLESILRMASRIQLPE